MAKYRPQKFPLVLCAIVMILTYGCRRTDWIDHKLNLAESMMESRPDSSLLILDEIDDEQLKESQDRARYALLKSMALEKNYIDTATFDVLQPAIDYYLKKGNADEKFKIYYYQGRIHENGGAEDLAMQSYIKGLENCTLVSDSLTLARMLVAQGRLYYKEYRIDYLVDNNLKAADIYGLLGRKSLQLKSCLRALQGEIVLGNKQRADSIFNICNAIIKDSPVLKNEMLKSYLLYSVSFGLQGNIKSLLEEAQEKGIATEINMTIARAYSHIGKPDMGLKYLSESKIMPEDILDSLTYWSVKTEILENMGEDGKALDAYRNYSRVLEIYHDRLFSNELLFSEKKHEMEIENMAKIQKRDNIIKWVLVIGAILMLLTALIYYRYRLNRSARLLAERDAEKLQLEAKNLELENEKFKLETDNLHLQVSQLEEEKDRLETLLNKQSSLSDEARQLIRERIKMLNGLFAKAITKEENYGKEFQKYVEKIKKDKQKFQQSIGKVMEGTHPEFMTHLREHGLTEREINYVCLYAIGLRGKEIGSYLDLARHYNISTDIRRKLGLDSNGENLGPFIRKKMGE